MTPETFPNPGIKEATIAMERVAGRCAIVDEPFLCDVQLTYGPRATCITIEQFAALVERHLAEPTTAEGLAVALADAVEALCAPYFALVTVAHGVKDGVALKVEAVR